MIRACLFFLVMVLTAASDEGAADPRFVCYPVRPGDTASQLAFRLTGNEVNRHAAWFQILDSQRSQFIPKRYYGRIFPDWRVCIATDTIGRPANDVRESAMTRARPQSQRVTGLTANEYAFAWCWSSSVG